MDPKLALDFSRLGDAHFDRLGDRLRDAERRRLLLAQRLDGDRFERIRIAAAVYASSCLGLRRPVLDEGELCDRLVRARGTIPNHDAGALLMPYREHTLEFNQLHRAVAEAMSDFGLVGLLDTIDLPLNLRMVYGASDPARARQPYASAKLHSDVWAGVPYDAVIVVLPIFGDIERITIECGEMPRQDEMAWMRVLGDYADGDVGKAVPYEGSPMKLGHAYFADARLLHQTVRRTREGVRLSVDFRFRMKADGPYRTMLPEVRGVDSMNRVTSYEQWLEVGSSTLAAFQDSVRSAATNPRAKSAAPIYDANVRLIPLCDADAAPAQVALAG